MARRLKTIARYINENVDGLSAKICEGFYQSERKLFARISSFGKSRTGNAALGVLKSMGLGRVRR